MSMLYHPSKAPIILELDFSNMVITAVIVIIVGNDPPPSQILITRSGVALRLKHAFVCTHSSVVQHQKHNWKKFDTLVDTSVHSRSLFLFFPKLMMQRNRALVSFEIRSTALSHKTSSRLSECNGTRFPALKLRFSR